MIAFDLLFSPIHSSTCISNVPVASDFVVTAMDLAFGAEIAVCIFLWYFASAIANTTSRKILVQGPPLPVVLTMLQFLMASGFGFFTLRLSKIRPYTPLPPKAIPAMTKLTVAYTLGFLFVNAGYLAVNVSLAETLRSTEPLITVALAVFILKSEPVSTLERWAMLPIVLGGILSSMGDSSFSAMGFLFVCCSNLSFSLRSMFTKQLRFVYEGEALNVFYQVSSYGFLLLFGILILKDVMISLFGGFDRRLADYSLLNENIGFYFSAEGFVLVLVNGIGYVVYNQTSFYVLSRVRMVTHGVANAFRRIVTILFSVWYFGNQINLTNGFGIGLAVCGVLLYAKAKDSTRFPLPKVLET